MPRISQKQRALQAIKTGQDPHGLEIRHINNFIGRGVFARKDFEVGDFVCQYKGKRVTPVDGEYTFEFNYKGKPLCIDATEDDGSVGRLINENNLKPNSKMKIIDYEEKPFLCLFAIRCIAAGEEVRYDYGIGEFHWRQLKHKHDHHIIHRDLKAENVFYAAPTMIKVGDFGFSTFSRADQTLNTFCGSPPYAAPELFKDESYYGVYVDIWALGILLYFMVSGIMPFRAETVAKLKKCILDGTYTIPSFVSDSGQFLIRSMLKPAPLDRFSVQEIKSSEWLQGEEFPAPLEPYELNPTMSNNNVKHDEAEARKLLTALGISDDLIKQAQGRDSRSSVTGTYRIILHRIQKRNANFADAALEDDANPSQNSTMRSRRGKENVTPVSEKRQSKFCTIL